jgi:hypothetical protein
MSWRAWPGLALLCLAPGCERWASPPGSNLRAEFGVFYGGQVQERQEIPLVLDRKQQLQGFRLQRTPPPAEPLPVRWEISKPGTGRRLRSPRGFEAQRRVQSGQAEWRPGEPVFEQALPFSAGDPVGLWNLRVLYGDRAVLDRPFLVFDARKRERERMADGG